jgi:hypothetical protein
MQKEKLSFNKEKLATTTPSIPDDNSAKVHFNLFTLIKDSLMIRISK